MNTCFFSHKNLEWGEIRKCGVLKTYQRQMPRSIRLMFRWRVVNLGQNMIAWRTSNISKPFPTTNTSSTRRRLLRQNMHNSGYCETRVKQIEKLHFLGNHVIRANLSDNYLEMLRPLRLSGPARQDVFVVATLTWNISGDGMIGLAREIVIYVLLFSTPSRKLQAWDTSKTAKTTGPTSVP